MAIESLLTVLTMTGVVGTSSGPTLVQTTDANLRFVPIMVQVETTTVASLITPASFSVGTNASTYNNLLTITAMTGITAVNMMLQANPTLLSASVAPSTGIYLNITTPAVGTTYSIRVSILGFYY